MYPCTTISRNWMDPPSSRIVVINPSNTWCGNRVCNKDTIVAFSGTTATPSPPRYPHPTASPETFISLPFACFYFVSSRQFFFSHFFFPFWESFRNGFRCAAAAPRSAHSWAFMLSTAAVIRPPSALHQAAAAPIPKCIICLAKVAEGRVALGTSRIPPWFNQREG